MRPKRQTNRRPSKRQQKRRERDQESERKRKSQDGKKRKEDTERPEEATEKPTDEAIKWKMKRIQQVKTPRRTNIGVTNSHERRQYGSDKSMGNN